MKEFEITKVKKEEIEEAATFFSSKWGVPKEAYIESMNEGLTSMTGVPCWFIIKDNNKIVAGIGIIENDFHKRKDLRPNLCALYVTKEYERRGLARRLLDEACCNLSKHNEEYAYLITTHTEFYEKVGFSFYGDIEEDSGDLVRCYFRKL